MIRAWSWTKPLPSGSFLYMVLVCCSLLLLLRQCQSSFIVPTTTHRQHKQHQEHHYHFHTFLDSYQSSRCHGRISILSSQQQKNTIEEEEKEKSAKTKTKRRTWEESFQLLVSYKEKHGNCNVPQRYKDDLRLGRWVDNQRDKKEKLNDERIAKLNDLGFSWSNEMFEEQWDKMFEKLVQYAKEKNGDCNIPYNADDNDVNKELCMWVVVQRKRKSLLSEERRTKLDKLGLIWKDSNKVKADQKWNEQYEQLQEYKQKYGHCRVPQKWEEDPTLGQWVSDQRKLYKKGQLRKDRQMKLEEIDFTWKVRVGNALDYTKLDFQWFMKFGMLLHFLEEHGHCNAPLNYKKDPSLSKWVHRQRVYQKYGTLRQDRKEQLDDIGFMWNFDDQKDVQWNEKYKELKRFKEQNGHLRLPSGSSSDRILKNWACWQRVMYAAGKVTPERKALLDEIEFRWETQNSAS